MFKAALLALLIALLGWLPPILHFVTGPLGSVIGGFVGGSKARATPATAAGIGILMGVLAIGPLVLVAWIVKALGILPIEGFGSLVVIAVLIAAFVAVMGTLGAALGGHMVRRQGTGRSSLRSP